MKAEFTLKGMVEFMEAHGFHVMQVWEHEVGDDGVVYNPEQPHQIGAISMKIAPKAGD